MVREVALLAEGVDRNTCGKNSLPMSFWSPSSRRAWIEIKYDPPTEADADVALLAEGVDRNTKSEGSAKVAGCRPPRGGRG